ncbi:MAG TPA: phosphate ABC transporter permease subunit PstC [Candidatus Elarobacter sp.]|jgi:phosphate transport system permease protein|nr:phosphate ABC transporter permease subunit PstC [Candidatus Elarobacter sp.]
MIALQARRARRTELIAVLGLRAAAGFVIFAMMALLLYLAFEGTKTFYVDHFPVWSFLFSPEFTPDANHPGAAVFIVGTLAVTLFAIAVGGPFGVAVGVFLAEIAPYRMTQILKPAIEVMVGIPSVVYGWLGLTLLVPIIRTHTSSPSGFGLLAGGIVLSIMILPTVITLSEDAFKSVPTVLKEGSLALGATRWQTITRVMLPSASSGVAVALILGIARAVGETLAIQMVIGNSTQFPKDLFTPTAALTTEIVTDMPGATAGSLLEHSLFSMAFLLLLIAMVLIVFVRFALRKRA